MEATPRRLSKVARLVPYPRMNVIVDRAEGDDARLRGLPWGSYLIGCWQTEKLFADCRDTLLKEFRFRNAPNAQNAKWHKERQYAYIFVVPIISILRRSRGPALSTTTRARSQK